MAGRLARWGWKPLNGWRHFVGEVGIIVLGVLIALGLGAIATDIGWRVEVRAARKAISLELGEALGTAIERTRFSPCIERRLDTLALIVDRAAVTGRLPALGEVHSPPLRAWNRGIWDSSVSAQTTAHFDREELGAYVATYQTIDTLGDVNRQEMAAWTAIYALVGPGRAILPAEAADLRREISRARFANRLLTVGSLRLRQRIETYNLPIDWVAMRAFSERPSRDKEICQPIGATVPGNYGQAPFRNAVDRARRSPVKNLSAR